MKTILWTIIFVLVLIGCEKENENILSTSELLIGHWINPQGIDSIVTYSKSGELPEGEYGFTFNSDYSFIERKNVGWCATPPIAYGDFSGSWMESDSILNISVGFWGGTVDYEWKIIVLDDQTLKIIQLDAEYHHDN